MANDLFYPSDSSDVRRQIRTLIDRGYKVARYTEYQLKVGPYSYYPGKGTIVVDPCHKHSAKGFDALLELLEKLNCGSKNDVAL